MKYWNIVTISFIIHISCTYAVTKQKNNLQIANDSVEQLNLLRLEYIYFTSTNDTDKYDALYQKILQCANANEFDKLNYEIKRIELLNPNVLKSKKYHSKIQLLLFQLGLFNSCLENIEKDTLNGFNKEKSFLKTLCYNEENNFELIKEEIRKASLQLNKDTTLIISALQSYAVKTTHKISSLYQAILPGSGMIKEGSFKEGFTSFLLNGIFIASPILLAKQKLYFSAFTYGIMPLSKFYFGGIRHTKHLADLNQENKLKVIQQKNADLLYQFYNQ
jgi:hypothetical protein